MDNLENGSRTFIKLTNINKFTCTGYGAHRFKIHLSGPIKTFSEISLRLSNVKNYTTHNIYSNKKEKTEGERMKNITCDLQVELSQYL